MNAAKKLDRVALLVDHAKFGVRALCRALRTEEIDVKIYEEHQEMLKHKN